MSDEKQTWGTWEELLLVCAVKRHGVKNWDSVAMEIQTKTCLPQLQTTAQCCKQKYQDLKRRFKFKEENKAVAAAAAADNIPSLEEQLRKVRVDELKQEVQRYDLSIHSLQLKVKRLEEERVNQQKPDLDNHKTSLNDKLHEPPNKSEDTPIFKLLSKREEDSDRENRSVNESNSTSKIAEGEGEGQGEGGELIKNEPEPVRSGVEDGGVESESKEAVGEELGDSATQLSSDVQRSVSFGRKRKRKRTGDAVKERDVKSEPLIRLLEMIRTHEHVSMFDRRLKSQMQDTNNYKELIKQHVDLETIQTRVYGSNYYSSRTILAFYRDLLLLFNNAIVYFPKHSLESRTALQLRNLLSNEIKKETTLNSHSSHHQPKPLLQSSDSLLANHKSSPPIIVCRKRSSVSSKPSSSFALNMGTDHHHRQQQSDDTDKKPATDQMPPLVEQSLLKVRTEEKKPVLTGARSSRRISRNLTSNTPTTPSGNIRKKHNATQGSKGGGSGSAEKQEAPKTDKKKTETSDKKKSVVDFLKRIKKNSPVQTAKKSSSKGGNKCNSSEEQKRNSNNSTGGKKDNKGQKRVSLRNSSEKKQGKEETSPSKRSVGRPPKKTVEVSKVSGKRGRESGGKEKVAAKRQSKRARG